MTATNVANLQWGPLNYNIYFLNNYRCNSTILCIVYSPYNHNIVSVIKMPESRIALGMYIRNNNLWFMH